MSGRPRHRGLGACVLAVAHVLAFTAVAQAEPAPPGAPVTEAATPTQASPAPTAVTLSNDRTSTTWATPVMVAPIRAHPAPGAPTLARTRLVTEDGYPEVYLLLTSFTDAEGRPWVRLRIPGRPNGRIGWVARAALGEFHVTHWLLRVSLGQRRLRAYYNGRPRFTAPVGIGKPSSPTPRGHFWIRERFSVASRSSPYWPYALGTSDYSTLTDWPGGGVVGIHGDFGEPAAIPGDPSHGCIRMHDRDIAWLAPRIQLGTALDVTS